MNEGVDESVAVGAVNGDQDADAMHGEDAELELLAEEFGGGNEEGDRRGGGAEAGGGEGDSHVDGDAEEGVESVGLALATGAG